MQTDLGNLLIVVFSWDVGENVSRFLKPVLARNSAIIERLHVDGQEKIVSSTEAMLSKINRDELVARFREGLDKGLRVCKDMPEVRALDFSWYYGGRETGEALAYGFDSIKTKGSLAKSDLGPEGLPGVEIKSVLGELIGEYFSALPVHIALNKYTSIIKPIAEEISPEVVVLSLELVNLWNYAVALEAFENCTSTGQVAHELWVTMTRHDRSSVVVGHLN